MAGAGDTYRPFFCHNCGINLNPIEDYEEIEQRDVVAMCNCGWCGGYHSIDDVKRCEELARVSPEALVKGTIGHLLELRQRIGD